MIYNKAMNLSIVPRNIFLVFILSFLIFTPFLAMGQLTGGEAVNPTPVSGKINNPLPNITTLKGLLKTILQAMIKIGIPVVVLAIIYSGFLFVTSLGNPERLSKAKDAFIWSLIGAAVLLGSWAIAELIVDTVKNIK